MSRFSCCAGLFALLLVGCAQTKQQQFSALSSKQLPQRNVEETAATEQAVVQTAHRVRDDSDSTLLLPPEPAPREPDHSVIAESLSLERTAQREDESIGTAGGLTMSALEQMAIGNNPTLTQGLEMVRQAEGDWTQVGLYPNPVAGYTASEIGQDGKSGQEGAFVSQTFVTANKLQLNRAAAGWDIERNRWKLEAQRMRIINDVRSRFYEALGAQQTVTIAEELQKIAEAGVKTARARFDAKEVAQPDVLQAEIQLNEVQILLQNARYREQAARQQLANVIGIRSLPQQPLAGMLDETSIELDTDELWQQISGINPVLEGARAEVQRAQAQIQREEVEPIPDVQTQFSVQYDAATLFTVANAQIGLALPIHNRNQGNIAAAVARMNRATANVERLELQLRDRLASTHRRYNTARNQVERYRDNILPKAERNLTLTNEAYGAGQFDFLRVLTARRTLFETRVKYIASLVEMRQSLVELQGMLLTGGLSDPDDDGVTTGSSDSSTLPLTDTPKTN